MFDYNNAFCPICKEKYSQINNNSHEIFLFCRESFHSNISISIRLRINYAYGSNEKIISLERFSYDSCDEELYIDLDQFGFCEFFIGNVRHYNKFSKIENFDQAYEQCLKIRENLIFM